MQSPTMTIDTRRARIAKPSMLILLSSSSGSLTNLERSGEGARLIPSNALGQISLENIEPFHVVKIELPLSGEILDPVIKASLPYSSRASFSVDILCSAVYNCGRLLYAQTTISP